jgi:hypothetical protein
VHAACVHGLGCAKHSEVIFSFPAHHHLQENHETQLHLVVRQDMEECTPSSTANMFFRDLFSPASQS